MVAIETTRMSTRGQVIIPKRVRDATGSVAETLFAVSSFDDDTIVLRKIDRERLLQDFRNVRAKVQKRFPPSVIDAAVRAARRA